MMEVKKEEDMIIKQEMDDNKPTNGSNVQYKIDKSSQPIKTEKADDQQIKKEPQEQHGIDEIYAKSQLSQGQHRMTQRQHVFKLEEEIETEIVFDQSHIEALIQQGLVVAGFLGMPQQIETEIVWDQSHLIGL